MAVASVTCWNSGSSPRAWGTLGPYRRRMERYRFIPTCMGNSDQSTRPLPLMSVHPHVHGELGPVLASRQFTFGSSPRAWGTQSFLLCERFIRRFIPTCMGNSSHSDHLIQPSTVHPHVHGELYGVTDIAIPGDGSSPRAWGTPEDRMV